MLRRKIVKSCPTLVILRSSFLVYKEPSSGALLDWNSQACTECAREQGSADEAPMRLPEGEKSLLTDVVRARDTVEVNLDLSLGTALDDGPRQTICAFADEFALQDNLDSIS
jgi:hypothetical protein